LAYTGDASINGFSEFDVDEFSAEGLDSEFQRIPLAMGLAAADWISTVSPTYAKEIQTPEFGYDLDRLISSRVDQLVGILNGIDYRIWNPELDNSLVESYGLKDMNLRSENKRSLQSQLGLPELPYVPLLGIVSRLDYQKGINLAFNALDSLTGEWQFVLLGTGDPELESICRNFEQEHLDRSRCLIRFDADLARRIYAGTDMILIPSRYEPCGLAQMIGMRYGSIPIVRSTGGLKDTVVDFSEGDTSTGFTFDEFESEALEGALVRALEVFQNETSWKALQKRAMKQDFSWDRSARDYCQLYNKMKEIE
jgi:starch synthase